MSADQLTIVIEATQASNDHFSYSIDYSKYDKYAADLSGAIKAQVPSAKVIINEIPKDWYKFDMYCQLIPNEDEKNPHYTILPR